MTETKMSKLVSRKSSTVLERVVEEMIFLKEETPFRRCYVVEWKVSGIEGVFSKDWCINTRRFDDMWKDDARFHLKRAVELRVAEQILEGSKR
jgi:hypothetical protein